MNFPTSLNRLTVRLTQLFLLVILTLIHKGKKKPGPFGGQLADLFIEEKKGIKEKRAAKAILSMTHVVVGYPTVFKKVWLDGNA